MYEQCQQPTLDGSPVEREISTADALLRALSCSSQFVALFDAEDRLRHASASFREAYMGGGSGAPTFEVIIRDAVARGIGPKVDCGDVEVFLAAIRSNRRAVPQRAFEVDLLDGRWMWVTETLTDNGWLLMVAADITPLKANEWTLRKAHEDAVTASRTDLLTSLPNRRRVIEVLEHAVAAHEETEVPVSVALIDIDHFKHINDTLGHGTGDRTLVHFASTCRAALRKGDFLGRFGGEEFLLVLPGSTATEALEIVDRLRLHIGIKATEGTEQLPRYTFSAGIAEGDRGDSVDALLRRADAALYDAKGAGRNQVVAALKPRRK